MLAAKLSENLGRDWVFNDDKLKAGSFFVEADRGVFK